MDWVKPKKGTTMETIGKLKPLQKSFPDEGTQAAGAARKAQRTLPPRLHGSS